MTESKKSPEQMQLCFEESVPSDATDCSAVVSNVVAVDFSRRSTSSALSKIDLNHQTERSIIGQVLERARSLNW